MSLKVTKISPAPTNTPGGAWSDISAVEIDPAVVDAFCDKNHLPLMTSHTNPGETFYATHSDLNAAFTAAGLITLSFKGPNGRNIHVNVRNVHTTSRPISKIFKLPSLNKTFVEFTDGKKILVSEPWPSVAARIINAQIAQREALQNG